MKNLSTRLFTILMLAAGSVMAQPEHVDTAVFGRIRRAEMNSSEIPFIAHYITDVSGPRLTNSDGYRRAANWAISQFKKWGLVKAELEPWGDFGKQWEIEDFSISMKVPYMATLRAYPSPWSPGTDGPQRASVLVISPKQYLDTVYLKSHAADFNKKIILLTNNPVDVSGNFKPSAERFADTALAHLKDSYMVSRAMLAKYPEYLKMYQSIDRLLKQSGAVALLLSGKNNINGTVFVQGEYGYKAGAEIDLPEIAIAQEDAQRMKRLIGSGHPVELTLNLSTRSSTDNIKGYNVIAELPGSDPKLKAQVVMLGGHLDSWQAATGAADNGAGCIVMMEAIRLLDSLGLKPKRTVRIALWDGEEEGLLGSYHYVQNHFRDGKTMKLKPEQEQISAYYNLDNGTGKIRGIYAQGNTAVAPLFTEWLKPFNDLGATAVTMSNTGSTDHISFDWAGIPGFQFVQDPIDYETRVHHSNLDDYDHLLIPDLKQAAIIVASFVYQTANRTAMMPRKVLDKEMFVFDGF